MPVVDILSDSGLTRSKSEARRMIQQGGVRVNGEQIDDTDAVVQPTPGEDQVIQAGKRRFLRVVSQ